MFFIGVIWMLFMSITVIIFMILLFLGFINLISDGQTNRFLIRYGCSMNERFQIRATSVERMVFIERHIWETEKGKQNINNGRVLFICLCSYFFHSYFFTIFFFFGWLPSSFLKFFSTRIIIAFSYLLDASKRNEAMKPSTWNDDDYYNNTYFPWYFIQMI